MKLRSVLSSITIMLIITTVACSQKTQAPAQAEARPLNQEWKDYWYSGTAELNRYHLEQARYGEIHKGEAVLIFVTEDFLTDWQVKYEGGPKDQVSSVMKLNFTKKFWTGIYPYSLMTSIFTPIANASPSLKVTTSAQEWCGHSFSQLNLRGKQYQGLLRSYFMNEGDKEFSLDTALLEDEVWNQIRLNPEALPTGSLQMIPGTQFLRLRHFDFKATDVVASMDQDAEKSLTTYTLEYQDLNRTLKITFESALPHRIVSWEDTSGSGRDGQLTTRATLTKTLKSPYWGKNSLADSVLRKELGMGH